MSSSGQWPLADDDRADLLAAYGLLHESDDPCFIGAGMLTLDVTTAEPARFAYADSDHAGCPVARLGRTRFVGDLIPFYDTLAPLVYDRPRGFMRDGSRSP